MRAHNDAISLPHKLSFVKQNIKIDLSSEVQNVTHTFICGFILRHRSVMGHSGVAGKKLTSSSQMMEHLRTVMQCDSCEDNSYWL